MSKNTKSQFNDQLFNLKQISNSDGTILTDDELLNVKTINALINYDYGAIINQTTKLTIKIIVNEKEIVNAINEASYQVQQLVNDQVRNIQAKITGDFIAEQLNDEIGEAFNANIFEIEGLILNGRNLQDRDLTTIGELETQIKYKYGKISGNLTNLKIIVTTAEQQIVDEINRITFTLETIEVTVRKIEQLISNNFIKVQLNPEIAEIFKPDAFKLKRITINDRNLEDEDLSISSLTLGKIIETKINYNYGTILNQKTNLIIKVAFSQQLVVDAINETTYQVEQLVNDQAIDIETKITGNFIKAQLVGTIEKYFDQDKFLFNKITVNGVKLQNQDLTKVQIIDAKINYSYDEILNQETNLKIKVISN
ncbi:MAG: hypothetical protein REH79_00160 [Spiroplasma sp.]|nr:hypothetical protein [Spiroplasma sp.]